MRIVMIFAAVLAFAVPLTFTPDADAQCRSFHRPTYHRVYHEPHHVVAVPLVQHVPVLVPSHNFQYSPTPTVNGFGAQTPSLWPPPQQFAPQSQPQGYGSYGQAGLAQWQPQQWQPQAQSAAPAGYDLPVAAENVQVGLAMERDHWHAQGLSILKQECKSCHTYPGRKNLRGEQIWLFDAQERYDPSVGSDVIWNSIANGSMPKAGGDPTKVIVGERKEILRRMLTTANVAQSYGQ